MTAALKPVKFVTLLSSVRPGRMSDRVLALTDRHVKSLGHTQTVIGKSIDIQHSNDNRCVEDLCFRHTYSQIHIIVCLYIEYIQTASVNYFIKQNAKINAPAFVMILHQYDYHVITSTMLHFAIDCESCCFCSNVIPPTIVNPFSQIMSLRS